MESGVQAIVFDAPERVDLFGHFEVFEWGGT